MRGQAGFTLIELVVGATMGAVITMAALFAVRHLGIAAARADARVREGAAVDRLSERLEAEAASAWAVYVPANDAYGAPNADGHEVAFFTQDGAHRSYAWAYDFDAASGTVTRSSLVPGGAPIAGERFGPFDAFTAAFTDAVSLADPLFAQASAPSVRYAFASMPGAIGGNGIVTLRIASATIARTALLASATAPTTFTVVVPYTPGPPASPTPTPTPLPQATLSPTPPP